MPSTAGSRGYDSIHVHHSNYWSLWLLGGSNFWWNKVSLFESGTDFRSPLPLALAPNLEFGCLSAYRHTRRFWAHFSAAVRVVKRKGKEMRGNEMRGSHFHKMMIIMHSCINGRHTWNFSRSKQPCSWSLMSLCSVHGMKLHNNPPNGSDVEHSCDDILSAGRAHTRNKNRLEPSEWKNRLELAAAGQSRLVGVKMKTFKINKVLHYLHFQC